MTRHTGVFRSGKPSQYTTFFMDSQGQAGAAFPKMKKPLLFTDIEKQGKEKQ